MSFAIIDKRTWNRTEYFEHYFSEVPCTYSMTVKLDVTHIREKGQKLYPTMLYLIAAVVNRHEEFRTALNENGELGVYDEMMPCYTVFHKDTETFSTIWTEYSGRYEDFCDAYAKDVSEYGRNKGLAAKPDVPANSFPVSMIPWATFEGFNLNLQKGYDFLLPVFTLGRYYEEGGKIWLPLAIQVHHAVCDGFHVSRFVNELQELLNR